ncbi:HMG box protein [Paraphaeosphaeria minitans]|uniref:HMG box protein n=1 Tax=Paraphaeosphaeria minitans TaxID=565426 RepID=A0A9P6KLQ8_9PLEO|nr:HMG box protein [Paraphaeosphaeria minitans]
MAPMRPRSAPHSVSMSMASPRQVASRTHGTTDGTQWLTPKQVLMALASVQKGLHNVSNNLNELMHAYIKHTASVLSGEDGALEGLQLSESAQHMIDEADLATKSVANLTKSFGSAPAGNAADADAAKSKKRKREKKIKDPNAPKRPLTAAFLFAQSARPIIRKDLENELPPGAKLEPNAINLEVNKRWNEMTDEDKETWKASYRDSLETYNKEVAAYKASLGAAALAEEPAAEDDASENEADPAALDYDVDSDDVDASDDELSPTKAPTPPPTLSANGKTPRPNKRQKTAAAPAVNGTHAPIAPAAGQTPVPLPATRVQVAIAPPNPAEATPAKKDKKREKKVAAVTPAAKEPSPEENKKEKKKRATRGTVEAESEDKEKEKPTRKRDRSKRKSEGAAA